MPDDVDARGAGEGRSTAFDEHSPDLVGEELADDARIWRVYDKVAREEDRERVSHWNRGLDNLALFAGLFSAVTTAFIIEAQQDTEPDYARLTFLVLNASAAGVPFREEPFVVDSSVRLTNCLWIASLMLSLSAALIAIMGKDWIGMYLSRPACNPRQWAEIRTYRLTCVERWYMSGVIASAPVLLHVSLVLFAAGLVVFVTPDPFSQRVALGLALTAGCLYLIIVLSAIVFPTSPFKSPATQAVRRSLLPLLASLCEKLVYPPKRHPVAMLQQATRVLSAALSLSLSPDTIPLTHARPRRMRVEDIALLWDRLAGPDVRRHWIDTSRRCVAAFSARFAACFFLVLALARSALHEYRFRRQRPRGRPWHASLRRRLRNANRFDPWSDVRSEPSLDLLAQSLSHMNAMTQSPEVFGSILVALGDIAIGRKVAPLVSSDLRSRLTAEIRHNWRKADLIPLARFILVDQHLLHEPLIPSSVIELFAKRRREPGVKSETVVFAIVELCYDSQRVDMIVNSYFPDIVIQPRALQHLLSVLPRDANPDVIVVIAYHYWDHWRNDRSLNFEAVLRQRVQPFLNIAGKRRLSCVHGLLELLALLMREHCGEMITSTIRSGLLLKVLAAEPDPRHQPCIVPILGYGNRVFARTVWAALSLSHASRDDSYYRNLELALPLDAYTSYKWQKIVTVSPSYHLRSFDGSFEACLARTVARLFSPSRRLINVSRGSDGWRSIKTVEAGLRFLHTQLCHWRSPLSSRERFQILELLLEETAFKRFDIWVHNDTSTSERIMLRILTVTARWFAGSKPENWIWPGNPRASLCSFSFSTAKNFYSDQPAVWDLGKYLREASSRIYWDRESKRMAVSMRRLHRAIRDLRPMYALYKCPEMWDRIGLPHDKEYGAPFWDDEGFDLGPLLPQDDGIASVEAPPQGTTIASVVSEESLAQHYLDASMR